MKKLVLVKSSVSGLYFSKKLNGFSVEKGDLFVSYFSDEEAAAMKEKFPEAVIEVLPVHSFDR